MTKRLCIAVAVLSFAAPAMAAPNEDVPTLVKQLQDKDAIVRIKAAKTLGTLGADAKEAIPALTDATQDADEDGRRLLSERWRR